MPRWTLFSSRRKESPLESPPPYTALVHKEPLSSALEVHSRFSKKKISTTTPEPIITFATLMAIITVYGKEIMRLHTELAIAQERLARAADREALAMAEERL